MITLKIDVTKISKDRLFIGKKGTYLDAVLIETPQSEYGDYMIVESITKEEREAGHKGKVLGNAKILNKREPKASPEAESNFNIEGTGDLPF